MPRIVEQVVVAIGQPETCLAGLCDLPGGVLLVLAHAEVEELR